ncbi:hypothetical protein NECAME_03026 [Necator americanus]|uniref:UV-stimulated scaffold protein A C-terminal domain-containing protein n=1 Tax=Necator americanus TaxID=51031 RepID=W2T8B6_NECAM|nr:hypothetical protein NECAME_03026 [Necator americanus]ETN77854.1 hypothetical protein NECAME_03026 [Necator americanus]
MTEDSLRLLRLTTAKLVNQAVNTPGCTVTTDSQDFKRLKTQVRKNESIIPGYVDYLFFSLKRSDSERRLALLSLFDYFFNRSHVFRLKTVENLQVCPDSLILLIFFSELLVLVCETNPLRFPLPGPIVEAKQLKANAIKTIKKWLDKFGAGYEKLNFVGDYLKESKAVDFESATAELLAERTRKAAEEAKAAEKLQKIASNVRRKFDESKDDISRCLASAETALSIVVPIFGVAPEFNGETSFTDIPKPSGTEQDEMQQAAHGYTNADTISVVLTSLAPEVTINEDNEALLESIRDAKVMLDKYRSNIISWQRQISGALGAEDLMRNLTNLKQKIEKQCEKISELKLKPKRKSRKGADSSESEESDLEDVPEKQLEEFTPPDEVPRYIMERVQQLEKEKGPCCSKSLEPIKSTESSTDTSLPTTEDSKSKSRIPVVSFGLDLKYWGENHVEAPIPRNSADCHRFWRPPDDDDKPLISEKEASFGEMRVITWVGEPRKADKRCKVRLPSGKLCPRMDFHKCPIHGIIVDRDDEGFPTKEIDSSTESTAQKERDQLEEEEYMRDLESATGQSFGGKPKKKKKKYEGTVRQRLEKKLLDPRTVKRVSAALDAARKAKLQRKFGGQFAQALSK